MKKLLKLLRGIPTNLISALVALVGFLLVFGQKIINIFLLWKAYEQSNSKPEGRKENIGEVDKEGYEQAPTKPATDADLASKPSGTDPEVIVTVSGSGKLDRVDKEPESDDDGSTDALIKKLEDAIKKS